MGKNNIALIFERADYYTLQQACDYLCLKHDIDNVTPNKLFDNILKYETDIYFHGKGFGVITDFDTPPKNLDNEIEMQHKQTVKRMRNLLDTIVHDNNGLLLWVNGEILERLRFSEYAVFYAEDWVFCGALHFDRLHDNPVLLEFLPNVDRSAINRVLAIYPNFYKYSDETWEETFNKSSLKVHEYEIYYDDKGEEFAEVYCKIHRDDLLILHKDLLELENNIIKNNPVPQKQLEIKPKKGVSIHKLQAKEQAKIIAKALWNNDRDNKIKIAEMARLVYSELHDNGFNRQLPQNQESLQDWIRDIAPTYATIGGRPRNEP